MVDQEKPIANSSIPQYINLISNFYGDGEIDIDDYFSSFERVSTIANWSNEERILVLLAKIKGEALTYVNNYGLSSAQAFDTLKNALVERYATSENTCDRYRKLLQCKQEIGENVKQFAARLQNLARGRGNQAQNVIQDDLLLTCFLHGLSHKVRRFVATHNPTTFEEAKKKATHEEKVLEDIKPPTVNFSGTSSNEISSDNYIENLDELRKVQNESSKIISNLAAQVQNLKLKLNVKESNANSGETVNVTQHTFPTQNTYNTHSNLDPTQPTFVPQQHIMDPRQQMYTSHPQHTYQTWQHMNNAPRSQQQQAYRNKKERDAQKACWFCGKKGHLMRDCWCKKGTNNIYTHWDYQNSRPRDGRQYYDNERGRGMSPRRESKYRNQSPEYVRDMYPRNEGYYYRSESPNVRNTWRGNNRSPSPGYRNSTESQRNFQRNFSPRRREDEKQTFPKVSEN